MGAQPVLAGLVIDLHGDETSVGLLGSKCATCGEVAIGTNRVCVNCGGDDITVIPLGNRGTLWTYTIVRHRPPGDYRGPDPFVPFGLGLVELPEGVRVMAPLSGDIDGFRIGQSMHVEPAILPGNGGGDLLAFAFAADA